LILKVIAYGTPIALTLASRVMLKITLHDSSSEFRLKLEGRLGGPWVTELEQCWKTARSTTRDRKSIVDLREVDFIDPAGQALLARMREAGVELLVATPLIRALVDEAAPLPPYGRVEGKAPSTR
jgi:hypothetical protein